MTRPGSTELLASPDLRWRALLAMAEQTLAGAGSSDCDVARQARWLVEEASGSAGADFMREIDSPAPGSAVARLDAMVSRRAAGEPLQYVLGHWPFRTLDLLVDERVLIPRPETEVVCGYALEQIDRLAEAAGSPAANVVDLGTGSGAIALSIAVERPATGVWAVERSSGALAVARANRAAAGRAAERVCLLRGDWYDPLPAELQGAVGVIVSNPPYVGASEPLPDAVAAWEPIDALVPSDGASGTEAIEAIVRRAPVWLAPGGSLVVEIGEEQGDAARGFALEAGFGEVEVRPDLSGRPRALVARLV